MLLLVFGFLFLSDRHLLPQAMPWSDFFILALASMRLVRLFVYDNITLFIREMVLDVTRVRYAGTGDEFVERVSSRNSLKRTLEKLLNCPWCMGVWFASALLFFYCAFPEIWIFFLILAVSGVASLLMVFANLIGWAAEHQKRGMNAVRHDKG